MRSPLLEAGLTKAEIREWSRELGLPTWDQPAAPCLASRIPYGLAVTPERLAAGGGGGAGAARLGLRDFRVRHHGDAGAPGGASARELPAALAPRAASPGAAVRGARASPVVLDLEGYRRGALNEGAGPRARWSSSGAPRERAPTRGRRAALRALGSAGSTGAGRARAAPRARSPCSAFPPSASTSWLDGEAGARLGGPRCAALGFRYVALDLGARDA